MDKGIGHCYECNEECKKGMLIKLNHICWQNSAEQEGGSYERSIKDAGNKTKLQELQTGHGERR